MIRQLWLLLEVRDIARSVAFYRDRLGFTVVGHHGGPGHEMRWCRVEREGASLMLQQAEAAAEGGDAARRRGILLYFVCDDADAMHSELSARGLELGKPLVAYYGMKQLEVPEPDGHFICFESESDGS